MRFLVILFVLLSCPAFAQAPMKSISFRTLTLACNNTDQLMPLDGLGNDRSPPALPGAGDFPEGVFYIHHVCVSHAINGHLKDSYAVVGHKGPNGDHISPFLIGEGTTCIAFATPALFTPGEFVDIHASCATGWHWAAFQLWFTQ